MLRRAHVAVVDRLGAVAVGVEQERAVVVVAVLRPRPGRAVVAVAGLGAGAPERVDLLARAGAEGDVEAARDRLLASAAREREVVPLGEVRVAVARSTPSGRARSRRSARDAARSATRMVTWSNTATAARSARGPGARTPRRRPAPGDGFAKGRARGASSPSASSTRASATRRPGLSGCCSRPSSRTARAPATSLSISASARNIHSHADGVKVAGPPKLSTVVPGSSATAWRWVAVSGTKTYVPAGASKRSPSSVNVRARGRRSRAPRGRARGSRRGARRRRRRRSARV